MFNTIRIASAILLNSNNDMLVVRKKNSSYYMLPGGKVEKGESLIQTLVRELKEELDLDFNEDDFEFLGTHSTQAANEQNTTVEGNIFKLKNFISNNISNKAEIEEVDWLKKDNYQTYKLAHLLKEFALDKWLADVE